MELKKDSELFRFLPSNSQNSLCLTENKHCDRYLSHLSSCYDEIDKDNSYQIYYHSLSEMERLIEEHTQQSTSKKMYEIFAKLNEWQEREDIKEGMVIGKFANISTPVFGYKGKKYHLDYFSLIGKHTPWMKKILNQVEGSLLKIWAVSDRCRLIKKFRSSSILSALFFLLFFTLLVSKRLWAAVPFLGLFITPVPFVFGGWCLYSLYQLLILLLSNCKKIRQKVYDEFVADTEKITPKLHQILRFYQLWCDNENRPFPENLQEIREIVDRAAAIHTMIINHEIDEYLFRRETWNDPFWFGFCLRCQGLR